MRKAVVKNSDGFVENIIEIEEGANWLPPEGHILIDAGDGSLGDTWDGTDFIKPEPIIPEPVRDYGKEINELKARLEKLEVKPLVFEPPEGTGIPEKVEYIEQYLKKLQGRT